MRKVVSTRELNEMDNVDTYRCPTHVRCRVRNPQKQEVANKTMSNPIDFAQTLMAKLITYFAPRHPYALAGFPPGSCEGPPSHSPPARC
jgi:hypothetical protein